MWSAYLQKQPCHLLEETGVQLMCPASHDLIVHRTLTKQAQNTLAAAQTKMERSILNIKCKDRKKNIWVRERTPVISAIREKWNGPGQGISTASKTTDGPCVSQLRDHMTKKRRQGRPAKRWRDDLDKYWSDTIWQRTAQYLETACCCWPTKLKNNILLIVLTISRFLVLVAMTFILENPRLQSVSRHW